MKLQFSLSEEDRKRVRELRDSTLKKRHLENHKAKHRRSLSDNRIGGPITKTIAENITEEIPFDHPELNVTDEYVNISGDSLLHVSEQSFKHAHPLTELKVKRHLPSQMVLHQMSDCSKALVFGNISKLGISSGASLEKYKYISPKANNVQDKVFNNNVKGMINVYEGSICQGVGPYLGQKEKFRASGIHAGGSTSNAIMAGQSGNLKSPQTMPKSFSSGMLSQIKSEGKSNLMESFVLKRNTEWHNVIPATNSGILGSKNLNVDKNSTLHIGMDRKNSIQNKISHADPSSAPFNSSMAVDNAHKTVSNRNSTVLNVHAGISGERKHFMSVKVEKGCPTGPLLSNHKDVGEKQKKLNFMLKEGICLDLNATSGALKAMPSSQSGAELRLSDDKYSTTAKQLDNGNKIGDISAKKITGVNKYAETMAINKHNNEQQSLRGNALLLDETAYVFEKVQNPNEQISLVEVARTSKKYTSQDPSNKLGAMDELSTASMKRKTINESGDGNTISEEARAKVEISDAYENDNEGKTFKDRSLLSKRMFGDDSTMVETSSLLRSSVEVARTLYGEMVSQIPSDEYPLPENTNKKAEELESNCTLVSPIDILDPWMPRHLCITTGSNLIRDFVDSFTFSTAVNLNENSSVEITGTKNYGDAYLHGNEGKVSPSSVSSYSENSSRSLKSSGGLIEQVVRIVVVIVACGILFRSR